MKPLVFFRKSFNGLKRRTRVVIYDKLWGKALHRSEMSGSDGHAISSHSAFGLLLKGGYVLSPSNDKSIHIDTTFCLPVNYARGKHRLMYLSLRTFLRKKNSEIPSDTDEEPQYFLPPHIWSDNFYHAMVEVLPAIQWALVNTSLKIVTPPMNGIYTRSFQHFGWDVSDRFLVFDGKKDLIGRFQGLTNIRIMRKNNFTIPNPDLLTFYKSVPSNHHPAEFKILLVSRKLTGDRRILNEEALFEYLQGYYACERLSPESDDFHTQVQKIQSASLMIGSHGAGLTNLLFNPRLQCLIELCLEEKVNDSYISLSEAMGVRHSYFFVRNNAGIKEKLLNIFMPMQRKSFTISAQDMVKLKNVIDQIAKP